MISGISCSRCKRTTTHYVTDSRQSENSIKRRRRCSCGNKFTTYEIIGNNPLVASVLSIRNHTGKLQKAITAFEKAASSSLDEVTNLVPYAGMEKKGTRP